MNLINYMLVELLVLLLKLHLWNSLKAWLYLLHVCWLLLLNKLEERSQPIFVLEEVLDGVLILSNERRLHETILGVLDQLSEVNHQSPRVWSQSLKTFKEDGANLLLNIGLRLHKQAKQYQAEEVSVAVRISQLIDNAIHEAKTSLLIQLDCNFFEEFICWRTGAKVFFVIYSFGPTITKIHFLNSLSCIFHILYTS